MRSGGKKTRARGGKKTILFPATRGSQSWGDLCRLVRGGARLEGGKALAKEILEENHIPTASFATFTDATLAKQYLVKHQPPYVIKADGLAAGKGVIICPRREEPEHAP